MVAGIAGVAWVMLTGCVTYSQPQSIGFVSGRKIVSSQSTAEIPARQAAPKPSPSEGSLWSEQSALGELFVNAKARRIGDIITIRIVENANASNKATTSTGRSSDLSAGIGGFFGAENDYTATQPFFNPFSRVSGDISSDYQGTGSTQRSGALSAYMTARVVDVLPNGNLYIQGNREVKVNNENQIITLSGLIRPRDISADNVIQSTYIADAQIAYSGTGIVNDRQKPGWFTRIMDKVWPF
jgi:flagellar L-ring protein precursor FlgH